MNQSRLSNLGIALVLGLVLPGLAFAQGNGNGNNNRNFFKPQPVLIYTTWDANTLQNGSGSGSGSGGGTGTSDNIQTLVVYNNGLVVSTGGNTNDGSGGSSTTNGTTNGNINTALVTQAQVGELFRLLKRGGALKMGGGPQRASSNGSLLHTVTIIIDAGNQQDGIAKTFSFFDSDTGNGARVSGIINNFMNQSFGTDNGGTGSGSGS
jgi:hypothetical protein